MKRTVIWLLSLATLGFGGVGVAHMPFADTRPHLQVHQHPRSPPDKVMLKGAPDKNKYLGDLVSKLGISDERLSEAMEKVLAERPKTRPTSEVDRAAAQTSMDKALASQLGIEESRVKSVFDERNKTRAKRQEHSKQRFSERLKEAASDQELTQDEANAVQKAADKGIIGFNTGRHR